MQTPRSNGESVAAARRMRGTILTARHETESGRRLAPAVVDALSSANLFRLAVPRAHGGLEADPVEALCVYEELAAAEASAAWIIWNNSLPALAARTLAPEVRHALFSDATTIYANSTRPSGRAERVSKGVRVTGRWSLVSGCELATHVLLRCAVASGAAGSPELVMAYLPRQLCEVHDTWHAGGLRGSGSHDVSVRDALVPEAHVISFADPVRGDAPLHRMPFAATLSAGCAAICLGIAAGALDALVELASRKTAVDTGIPLREQPSLLACVGRAKVSHWALRTALHVAVANAFETCRGGGRPSLDDVAQIFGAAHVAARGARDVVRQLYDVAGTSALYEDCPLERAHRDIHAVAQHVILSDIWVLEVGRLALGVEPVVPMFAS